MKYFDEAAARMKGLWRPAYSWRKRLGVGWNR